MDDLARILIITVVKKGLGDAVIEASLKGGAEGATLIYGRGTGIHERKKILGVALEPEKEIILSLVYKEVADAVIKEINAAVDLEKPGSGIAFTVPVDQAFGITHEYLSVPEDEAATTDVKDAPAPVVPEGTSDEPVSTETEVAADQPAVTEPEAVAEKLSGSGEVQTDTDNGENKPIDPQGY
jgi:nitrogen regulatory protein PII